MVSLKTVSTSYNNYKFTTVVIKENSNILVVPVNKIKNINIIWRDRSISRLLATAQMLRLQLTVHQLPRPEVTVYQTNPDVTSALLVHPKSEYRKILTKVLLISRILASFCIAYKKQAYKIISRVTIIPRFNEQLDISYFI